MANLVQPEVFFVGATGVNFKEVDRYLKVTGQEEFSEDWEQAESAGIPSGMILCSMFAKLCYKSLVVGKNINVQKTRPVKNNLTAAFDQGHGSVFEHCNLNFLVTNCSRVFTHELVRHRTGTAFSQTSGRYCRLENIEFVMDPILKPASYAIQVALDTVELGVYTSECILGLRKPNPNHPDAEYHEYERLHREGRAIAEEYKWIPDDSFDFEKRKKITSAIRRIAPNGQANEVAFSVNIRTLRHMIQVRTARHAEWEIRNVFNQVYALTKGEWPLIYHGARERVHEDLLEVYGMKMQPYDYIPPEEI